MTNLPTPKQAYIDKCMDLYCFGKSKKCKNIYAEIEGMYSRNPRTNDQDWDHVPLNGGPIFPTPHRPPPNRVPPNRAPPTVEYHDKEEIYFTGSSSASSGNKVTMYQSYRGQLKVSIYVNSGLLTVHVMQARHLSNRENDLCNSFVRLSLEPDLNKSTRCITETILDTNHPVFDEKFSFELLDEDKKKRIHIALMNKEERTGRNHMMGGMSFGLQHILAKNRVINGWYYILNEDISKRKHLQVISKKQEHLAEIGQNNIPSVNQDVLGLESHTLVVPKGDLGFGFSLTGCSPVFICRVEPGLPAYLAGVKAMDCITRINGVNVSRSGAESVARLVKNSSKQLVIEVQRQQGQVYMDENAFYRPLSSTMRAKSLESLPDRDDTAKRKSSNFLVTCGGSLQRKKTSSKDKKL